MRAKKFAARRRGSDGSFVVKVGSVEIPVYHYWRSKGEARYEEFVIAFYSPEGKRVRRCFSEESSAREEAERVACGLSRGHPLVAGLSPSEVAVFNAAVSELAPIGIQLNVAVSEFVAAKRALPEGTTLLEAARDFARRHPVNRPSRTVAQVVEELIADRTAAGCSEEHTRDLTKRLTPFAESFPCPVSGIASSMVADYLRNLRGVGGRALSNRSRDNARRLIVTLFNFARQRGYIGREHAEEVAEIPRPKIEAVETGVFTPSAMAGLLHAAGDELRAALAIGGFAGLRTAEIHRLNWSDIHLGEGVIIVGADKAKTATRRVVPISDNLMAWLKPLAKSEGAIVHHSHEHQLSWDFGKLAGRCRVRWVRNGLRHSFCSYRLAITGNAAQTAYEAGNSVGMIDRHYRALVTAQAGAEWFAIRPG